MTTTWQTERRGRILVAAREALEEQEYESVQMRDVAQRAGVALGTLYRCFTSKEHLYAAVLSDWAAGAAAVAGADHGTPEARMRARIHGVIAAYGRLPQFYRAHVTLQSSADPNARALLTEFGRTARASLAAEVAVLGAASAEDAATMLWALITSRLSHAIYRGGSLDEIHRIADEFVDLLVPRLRDEQVDAR
ncbi:TetR/AcrR family transcriptional regulator [Cryptosporangium aurantiacum]|uniref:Transcriptional regulator, TetR family n=1 Tax=Cryptosporangium aurantiacum TaxID=134849 RepID=A0A1M7RK57_9ACTN|nr:TetR/AcrR family transcriptional regulator [Cryptosporangium aurantiacum]SHN46541.1 transcriptional regulator, TetR family [Cryptosporangium aurantiacum]